MLSRDKFTLVNSDSEIRTDGSAAPAQYPSASPKQAASPSEMLHIKNEIFRTVLDQSVVGFVQSDLSSRITFVNDRYCEITGYSREELLGKQWLDITHPDDLTLSSGFFRRMQQEERSCTFEKRYIRKNGEIIWVNIGASQRSDAGSAFVVDITERKQSEALALQFGNLLQSSFNEIYMFDADHLHFIQASEGAQKNLGYSLCELKQLTPVDINPLFTLESFKHKIAPLRSKEKQQLVFETTQKRKDGTTYPVEIRLQLFQNQGYLFLASIQDITERKRAEALLHESSSEIEDLYNHAPCGYHSLDQDSVIRRINNTELAWLGYSRDEVIGRMKWTDLLAPASQQAFRKDFPRFRKQGYTRDFEIELMRKDGTIFVGLVNASAIYDSGGVYVMSRSTVLDITERRMLEKEALQWRNEMAELQKLNVASQTASAFAHELNQPLLAISSYCEAALMLLGTNHPNLVKVRTALEGSKRQAHHAGQSIRELLELLDMNEFPIDVFDLNEEVLATMDVARSEYELEFHPMLQLENELPMVRANRTHIRKVLLNLLHNSTEAMQDAGKLTPSITVTICAIKKEKLVRMTIQDNGPGIKKEDIKRLFEPFFTTKPTGIGMGLAISHSLIEANGGQLWVDPADSSGATFHLTLPVAT